MNESVFYTGHSAFQTGFHFFLHPPYEVGFVIPILQMKNLPNIRDSHSQWWAQESRFQIRVLNHFSSSKYNLGIVFCHRDPNNSIFIIREDSYIWTCRWQNCPYSLENLGVQRPLYYIWKFISYFDRLIWSSCNVPRFFCYFIC